MFFDYRSLKSLHNILKWNTHYTFDISYILYECSSLKSLFDILIYLLIVLIP